MSIDKARFTKAFNARIPDALHAALRRRALASASARGGQVNLNRELVAALFQQLSAELPPGERVVVEEQIRRL